MEAEVGRQAAGAVWGDSFSVFGIGPMGPMGLMGPMGRNKSEGLDRLQPMTGDEGVAGGSGMHSIGRPETHLPP